MTSTHDQKCEQLQVIQRRNVTDFKDERLSIKETKMRNYVNYNGGRFKLVCRNLIANKGVAKHSKYGYKLQLEISDPAIIAEVDLASEKIKQFYKLEGKVFKPFASGQDGQCTKRLLTIKIPDEVKLTSDGKPIRGGVLPDDYVSAVFTTSIYSYGQYYGFSHKLEKVKVESGGLTMEDVL